HQLAAVQVPEIRHPGRVLNDQALAVGRKSELPPRQPLVVDKASPLLARRRVPQPRAGLPARCDHRLAVRRPGDAEDRAGRAAELANLLACRRLPETGTAWHRLVIDIAVSGDNALAIARKGDRRNSLLPGDVRPALFQRCGIEQPDDTIVDARQRLAV